MTVGRMPQIIFSPNDNLGSSSPGARLSFYEAGSTTNFKAIFSDFASTPLANPVLADGVGRFPNIVLDDATSGYNVKFETSDGATIPVYTQQWFEDNVSFAGSDPLLLGDGTAADPTYSFASEPSTGIFLAGSGLLAASILGNEVVQWTAQGLNIATSGESATPSLYLEGDIDTGWRQDGNNNWTFSSVGEDELSLSNGLMSLPGTAGVNNVLSIGAKTGRSAVLQMAGDDIAQPMTGISGTTTFGQVSPLSVTDGGLKIAGLSEGSNTPLQLEGLIGSAAPGSTVPAIRLRAAKYDGGTGVQNLASSELAFALTDSVGTNFLEVFGDGSLTANGRLTSTRNIDGSSETGADLLLGGLNGGDQNLWIATNTALDTTFIGCLEKAVGNTSTLSLQPNGGTVALNLPTSAGVTGTLYSNSGVVTVSP